MKNGWQVSKQASTLCPTDEHAAAVFLADVRQNAVMLQDAAADDPERCYFGNSPYLSALAAKLGKRNAKNFIYLHLCALVDYCGVKRDAAVARQLQRLCGNIYRDYHWLKTDEIALFCARFSSGDYGRFYAVFDPLIIEDALKSFLQERGMACARREKEEEAADREMLFNRGTNTSYLEYKRIEERAAQGDAAAKEMLQKPTTLTTIR